MSSVSLLANKSVRAQVLGFGHAGYTNASFRRSMLDDESDGESGNHAYQLIRIWRRGHTPYTIVQDKQTFRENASLCRNNTGAKERIFMLRTRVSVKKVFRVRI